MTVGVDALATVLAELRSRGIAVHDIGLRRPTLDDVFLSLTGHAAEIAEANGHGDTTRPTKGSATEVHS